jgi:hypothetical protein
MLAGDKFQAQLKNDYLFEEISELTEDELTRMLLEGKGVEEDYVSWTKTNLAPVSYNGLVVFKHPGIPRDRCWLFGQKEEAGADDPASPGPMM